MRARPLVGGLDAWVAAGGIVEDGIPVALVRATAGVARESGGTLTRS